MKNDLRTSRKVYRYFIYVLFVMLQSQVSCVYGQQKSAYSNDIKDGKSNLVGLPHFVLSTSHESGGYKVYASCIDSQYSNRLSELNNGISYNWGVKFTNKSIEWRVTKEPSIFVPLENKNAVIFFKISDSNGNESTVQSVQTNTYNVFFATNNHLKIDANRNIYKDDESSYSYKYGKVYLTRDSNLPSEYQHDIWTATKAVVFSPFASQYTVSVSRGEMSIKNILPQEELDYIINNSESGQGNIYTIALLNPENKIIQFLPFTITLK